MNMKRFLAAALLAAGSVLAAAGCSSDAGSVAPTRDPVVFVGGGTIDDHVASVLLFTMDGIDYRGNVTANSDCLYSYAMQSQWKVQTFLDTTTYPIALSESRPLNPFPMEYRTDSIKVYDSRLIRRLSDNPQWPGNYPSGEGFLKDQLARAVETGHPLTLLITNPITPLSMVLKESPALEKGIKRVIWMGGAINVPGNLDPNTLPVELANPKAEWNAFWDPYAVDWIFRNTAFPLLIFPLDVTNQAKLTAAFMAALKIQATQYRYSNLVESLYALVENEPYFEMWNSLTAVFVSRPDIFEDPTPMRLGIVTEGYMQGAITQGPTGRQALVYLNIRDKPGFYDYVLGQLRRN